MLENYLFQISTDIVRDVYYLLQKYKGKLKRIFMSSISHIKAVIWSVERDNKSPKSRRNKVSFNSIGPCPYPEYPAHTAGPRGSPATSKSYGLKRGLLLWSEMTVMARQIDF